MTLREQMIAAGVLVPLERRGDPVVTEGLPFLPIDRLARVEAKRAIANRGDAPETHYAPGRRHIEQKGY